MQGQLEARPLHTACFEMPRIPVLLTFFVLYINKGTIKPSINNMHQNKCTEKQ